MDERVQSTLTEPHQSDQVDRSQRTEGWLRMERVSDLQRSITTRPSSERRRRPCAFASRPAPTVERSCQGTIPLAARPESTLFRSAHRHQPSARQSLHTVNLQPATNGRSHEQREQSHLLELTASPEWCCIGRSLLSVVPVGARGWSAGSNFLPSGAAARGATQQQRTQSTGERDRS